MHWRRAYLPLLALIILEKPQAAKSVVESASFSLNLDGRESIAEREDQEYVLWLTEYFTTEEMFDFGKVGIDADPDFDGEDNRFEYFAGLNPRNAEDDFEIEISPGRETIVEFHPLKAGVEFTIEISSDLQIWREVGDDGFSREGDVIRLDPRPDGELEFFRVELMRKEGTL